MALLRPRRGRYRLVDYRSVTPGYFSMMGIPLLRGAGRGVE